MVHCVAPWVAEMPDLTVIPFRNNSQITVMLIVRTNNTLKKKRIPKKTLVKWKWPSSGVAPDAVG